MKTILFLAILLHSFVVYSQQYYLHCGHLWDGVEDSFQKKATIHIKDTKIVGVFKGYKTPVDEEIEIIDLKNKFVLPGLIDMHVHIESETGKNNYLNRFILNDVDVALKATKYAKKTLLAGFTTVRDLGGRGVNIALRKAVEKGYIIGPRIITAGKSIATTGGHADPTNGMKKMLMGDPGAREGVVNGVEDCRKAVRQRYKNGADLIKITATGGVLSLAKNGQNPQFTEEELQTIVQTAKDYGMHVAAHAHGREGMKRAVIAGVKTIEHGTYMDPEVMRLMKEKNTYYVPTISAGIFVEKMAKVENYYPAIIVPKALAVGAQIKKTFVKAYEFGVPIAFGTDAGVFPHGENGKEFEYMVERGMPAIEALKSATMVNANILQLEKEIGSIEKDKWADIIATQENPFNNIKTLQKVRFVMKNGLFYKNK